MKLVVSLVAALAATTAFANPPAAAPASKGDPKAAESIVNQVCAGCHAVDGNSAAAANPKLAGWFTGQVIKATGGKANPATVNALVAAKLGL